MEQLIFSYERVPESIRQISRVSWILRNLTFIYAPAASQLGHARSGAPWYAEKHSGNGGHTAVGEGLSQSHVCVGASFPRGLLSV
ncbi:hypothetical protein ACTXK4_23140, partial [Pseudomonas helleri]|uniref:hypothetical protein n=1 Tax=Pseudomonas helleri TaxID=1608996 RepID=UPI003FD45C77